MVISLGAVMESELIVCRECEYEFGVDEADVCRKCHSHICPRCGECLCKRVRDIFPLWGSRG